MTGYLDEHSATRIMAQAMVEQRCAEFMECLFEGGSATVDTRTGKLVLLNGDMLSYLTDVHPGDDAEDDIIPWEVADEMGLGELIEIAHQKGVPSNPGRSWTKWLEDCYDPAKSELLALLIDEDVVEERP